MRRWEFTSDKIESVEDPTLASETTSSEFRIYDFGTVLDSLWALHMRARTVDFAKNYADQVSLRFEVTA